MRPATSRLHSHRSWAISVVAMALGALTGCSSSGGGSGGSALGGNPSIGFNYPTLAAAANHEMLGFSSAYTETGNVITSTASPNTDGTITLTRSGEQFTFMVSGIPVGNASEPEFQFTVNLANPGTAFGAAGSIAGAGCGNCFRTGTVDAVAFTYLDLAASGMVYSTLGVWSKPSTVDPATTVGGAFAFGVVTRGVDLPTSGGATYTGPFVGQYADGTHVYTVGAAANAVANFGTRSVSFSTSNTQLSGGAGVQDGLNLTGTMSYSAGSNSLSGTVQTPVGATHMSGVIKGAFFGPPSTTAPFAPPELGGVVAVADHPTSPTQSMVGSFALKQ